MNIMFGFRTLDPDPDRAQALVDAVRIIPYDGRDAPATRIVSPGRADAGTVTSPAAWSTGSGCTTSTSARSSTSETGSSWPCSASSASRKASRSHPTTGCETILTQASAAGELMAQANTFAKRFPDARYWPDRQWFLAIDLDNSAQRGPDYDQLLERAAWFYEAVSFSAAMKSRTPGVGQAYLGGYTDDQGTGSTAPVTTRSTSPRTRPPSCSGPSPSTTSTPVA